MKMIKLLAFPAVLMCLLTVAGAQTMSGGNYILEEGGITNGGGTSSGGNYSTSGASGQSITGESSGGNFSVRSGFYTPTPFAPTAANVSLSGQILSPSGRGIFRARIMLTDSFGQIRFAMSNPFGFYRFAGIASGQNYIITVSSKEYQFAQPSQIFFAGDNVNDLNFTALP